MKKRRGQVTIFIIVAIVIVVLGILIYMFYPQIKSSLGGGEENPSIFIQTCLEESIQEKANLIELQGGSFEPEFFYQYLGDKIEYLCYTGEYYETCVVQESMLKQHVETEIKSSIQNEVQACFNSLRESYQDKGYNVQMRPGDTIVELLPKRIVTRFDYRVTLTKDGTENYESFNVVLNNNLYELISIANSILAWEAIYGDAETTTYMNYYPDLKVEKKKETDGTTIYILTDRNTGNKFQFASRSVAWPPGYDI